MHRLLLLALIGFIAELGDGSLGMDFGLTSSSLLLILGLSPAIASASVHMAEIVTTAAAGFSHLKLGNIDKRTVLKLIIPGSIGAFIGACCLSYVSGDLIKPYIAGLMFILGCSIIYRTIFPGNIKQTPKEKIDKIFAPLGLGAGFIDAIGGGGWSPVTAPVLLSCDYIETRKVIGSVNASQFAVTVAAALGFIVSLGRSQLDWNLVLALMIGGVIAAPIAALIVRVVSRRFAGVFIGGIILITNSHILMNVMNLSASIRICLFSLLAIIWLGSLSYIIWNRKSVASCYNKESL